MHARLSLWKDALLQFGEPARFAIMLAFRRRQARRLFHRAMAGYLRAWSEIVSTPSRAETQLRRSARNAVLLTVETCTSLLPRLLLPHSAVAEPLRRFPPERRVRARCPTSRLILCVR